MNHPSTQNFPRTDRRILRLMHHAVLQSSFFCYRHIVSPLLHTTQRTLTGTTGACRFQPTCSEYAELALHEHGPLLGGKLALLRFLRCHPFSRGGFDPVPGTSASSAGGAGNNTLRATPRRNSGPFTIEIDATRGQGWRRLHLYTFRRRIDNRQEVLFGRNSQSKSIGRQWQQWWF